MSETHDINGGSILVEALARNGVDTIYCVPGESYLPVLDALHQHPTIRTIVSKHEGAASNMADAYGKITGRPGIAFVTRGPGATHASNGVHTAMQDSTPMILFIGQVASAFKEREAFQEINYRSMYGSLAKWVTEVDAIERLPEIIHRAFNVAMSGRKGPVVIALPEEVVFDTAQNVQQLPAAIHAEPAADPQAILALHAALQQAQRPLVIVGGTGWTEQARADLTAFVERYRLPVAAGFRRQDIFDNRNAHYVGQLGLSISPALVNTVKEADLLLVLGSRMSETTSTDYQLIRCPQPVQKLIHVHPQPEEINRVFHCDIGMACSMPQASKALAALPALPSAPVWSEWTQQARSKYVAHNTPPARSSALQGVDMGYVVGHLNRVLPEDAVISNGAGNYTVWVHRHFQYKKLGTELAPTNGAMGYGLPAAIAAKLQCPERTVVCFAGDGCFLMYPQELATAKQFGANIIVIVVNNGMYGTIRMHQEREFPGRISATQIDSPDFVQLALAFGAHAERVQRDEDFPAAFERAQQAQAPALIELITDPLQITPTARI